MPKSMTQDCCGAFLRHKEDDKHDAYVCEAVNMIIDFMKELGDFSESLSPPCYILYPKTVGALLGL